jgi:hypothetical protein
MAQGHISLSEQRLWHTPVLPGHGVPPAAKMVDAKILAFVNGAGRRGRKVRVVHIPLLIVSRDYYVSLTVITEVGYLEALSSYAICYLFF